MTSVARPCFTTQHQICKTKTDFLVSDRSRPKTDVIRPHHWKSFAVFSATVRNFSLKFYKFMWSTLGGQTAI